MMGNGNAGNALVKLSLNYIVGVVAAAYGVSCRCTDLDINGLLCGYLNGCHLCQNKGGEIGAGEAVLSVSGGTGKTGDRIVCIYHIGGNAGSLPVSGDNNGDLGFAGISIIASIRRYCIGNGFACTGNFGGSVLQPPECR